MFIKFGANFTGELERQKTSADIAFIIGFDFVTVLLEQSENGRLGIINRLDASATLTRNERAARIEKLIMSNGRYSYKSKNLQTALFFLESHIEPCDIETIKNYFMNLTEILQINIANTE